MPLHLGSSEKVKIHKNGSIIRLDVFTEKPITNGQRLLSSEDYTLKDSKGTYITVKGDDK